MKFFGIFVWLSVFGLQSFGQSGAVNLSITNCLEYASGNNSNIKVARFDEQISVQQINEVKGRALPQANITGNFEDKLIVPFLIIPAGSSSPGAPSGTPAPEATKLRLGYQFNTSVVGEVTQMIIDPSLGIALKAAKQGTQLYKQQSQQISEETAYNIASAYYQVIVLQKQQELLRANLNTVNKTTEITELQFKNGVAKQVDVNRLKVNANNLKSQLNLSEMSVDQAMNALKYQMGMPLSQPVILTDTTLTFTPGDISWSGETDNIIANRIDYKVLQTNLNLQQLDKANNQRGYYPSLTAYANYGYNAQGAEFGIIKTPNNHWVDYRNSSLGLRLRVPVFDGFQRNSRNQQAKLKISQLKENINLSKQSMNLEIANAVTQYKNTLQRIEAEKQNVALAEEVYKVTQLEYKEGVTSSINLVTSEMSLREAQNTYTNTLLDFYNARLSLEKAKGTITTFLNSK
ncbi:MAG: TolC family protein [Opitutaceae bacterium]|nr:TolC family protein [Cytophagales bacterium]